jgi:metallo-beta-lactamase class B
MNRRGSIAAALVVLAVVGLRAQEGNDGGTTIRRGAAQTNQNRWNAKSPWGRTERSGPIALQKKAGFKIFDNVHYVGFQTVAAYLVSTSDGLVLIDSGYAQTTDWLLENVRAAGFAPSNIKYILVTHSHTDHAGGAATLKQATGARVAMSAEDWTLVERQQSPAQRGVPTALQRDIVVKDGDAITVGDTTFRFHFTPGHTAGSTSVEFPVRDGGRTYRALTPGGLGLHYAPEWGPTFKTSIQRLKARGDAVEPSVPHAEGPRGDRGGLEDARQRRPPGRARTGRHRCVLDRGAGDRRREARCRAAGQAAARAVAMPAFTPSAAEH